MQSPAVSRSSLKRAIPAHFILSLTILVASNIPAKATPNPVTINFDNLPAGVIVSNQYPQVTFSSPGGYYGSTIYTTQSHRSYPNSITSRYNGCGTFESGCGRGDVYLDFPVPVKNFSFYILGSVNPYYRVFEIDVYVNGSYYGTYGAPGNGQPNVPIYFDRLRSISNITNLRIRSVSNVDYYSHPYSVYYDDFTFTPSFDVNITSGRVGGILNGKTYNALLGADVALQASVAPSNLTGGTYAWSATGSKQQVSASNTNSSYTVRWTEPGTYQAKVIYSRNGFTASSTINVNVVIPKLTAFTATQAADRIVGDQCTGDFPPRPGSTYILGCPNSPDGIRFSATAQIPSGSYLTDLDQNRLKYVQIVSSLRKDITYGKVRCETARSSEADTESGWQLDTDDPYSTDLYRFPMPRFSEGYTLTFQEADSPSLSLTSIDFMYDKDAQYTNELFETYVVYFTGTNPRAPIFQRAIGFQNSPKSVARLAWRWGGQSVYDPASPYSYLLQFSLVPPRTYVAEAVDFMRPYTGNAWYLTPQQCPGGPPFSNNPIDSSRFFIRQQYCDILQRPPDGSWIYWIRVITLCGFDQTCINNQRLAVARGFYESAEFRQTHPALQNPGAPGYNEEYIKQLYRTLLRRVPDGAYHAWVDILNQTGDYTGVVGGFINSLEYRNRFYTGFIQCH